MVNITYENDLGNKLVCRKPLLHKTIKAKPYLQIPQPSQWYCLFDVCIVETILVWQYIYSVNSLFKNIKSETTRQKSENHKKWKTQDSHSFATLGNCYPLTSSSKSLQASQKYFPICTPQLMQTCWTCSKWNQKQTCLGELKLHKKASEALDCAN